MTGAPATRGAEVTARLGKSLRKVRLTVAGTLGLVIVMGAVLTALLAPVIATHDPSLVDITKRLRPPTWLPGHVEGHWLGTDQLGRDLFSRIVFGTRSSLLVAMSATLAAAVVGAVVALVASHFGGWIDQVLMRLVDIQLAFPPLLLAITIMAVTPGSLFAVILVLALSGWAMPCRMVRSRALALRELEYVQAATSLGAGHGRVILRHLLPNVLPTLIIVATLQAAQFILAEAALSFLGLGLPPAIPSWGSIMNQGRPYIEIAWWIETFSGLAIAILVTGIGMLGNWLRDVLDPRLRT